jgi:predicted RNA-binding protein with PUA-like domain
MKKQQYWLFKSEPSEFSIDDLARSPNQSTIWSGIRNYRARNLLRDDVRVGDKLFFYHSSTDLIGIAGVCVVTKSAFPDPTAFDKSSPYFDAKSDPVKPPWVAVEVSFGRKFSVIVPLPVLKATPGLEKMMVCQQGSRLSIQPVTPEEWHVILRLADRLEQDATSTT